MDGTTKLLWEDRLSTIRRISRCFVECLTLWSLDQHLMRYGGMRCRLVVDRLEFWWCGVVPVLIEEVSKTQGYNMLVSFDVVTYAET